MKIVKLNAENVKKLVAVEITPSGEIVTISGKNGAGKTSVLDSIWWALAGTSNIQAQPIRKGQNKARIRLDMGELIVERRFAKSEDGETKSSIVVESAEGARFPKPQNVLDALYDELCIDPLAFQRSKPREQFDTLRHLCKLEVDIDKLDALNVGDFSKRTDINRDAKAKRAQADGIVVPLATDDQPTDESGLVDDLQKAGEHNTLIEQRKARREAAQKEANTKKENGANSRELAAKIRSDANDEFDRAGKAAIAAYEKAKEDAAIAFKRSISVADEQDREATDLLNAAAEIEKKIDAAEELPKPVDVAVIRQKIVDARAVNERIKARTDAAERKTKAIEEAKALEAQSKALTEAIEAREKAKADAITAAKLPVSGLGFGDGVVTFNDIPFDQSSSAEQLRVSMAIAMASNPKLRVIRITDGSLLDEDSLATISEMAKAEDFQVWIETVDSSGKVGIVIEDGKVKS